MNERLEGMRTIGSIALVAFLLVSGPPSSRAHCDTMDGPVVTAAKQALESKDVNLVLPWVRPEGEEEIRAAFGKVLKVRALDPTARDLADRYFFETLVRVHRAGEGAPYTGLQPAGRDRGPAIPAADKALEDGSAEALVRLLTGGVRHGVHARFHRALEKKNYDNQDVGAGREYINAYVSFVHYVENVYQAAVGARDDHHVTETAH